MPAGTTFFRRIAAAICLVLPWLTGCAAFHPMNGVPARYLPADMKAARRSGQRIIDLSLLNQRWDGIHRVDAGDVLGIYIGGVLGKMDENPQVQFPQQNSDFLPAAGVPVTVREDGTVSLPMIGAISVRGLTTRETEDTIRQAYTNHAAGKEYLPPGRERILVSLIRPRQVRVLVVRQDSRMEPTANAMVGMVNLGTSKRGSGKAVSLPAYKNDVLNALIATDGLPGLDAENAVYIIRRNPDLNGGDQALPPPFDPEQLIRENKANQRSVIRGQSMDNWNYRSQANPYAINPNATAYTDYRQVNLISGYSSQFDEPSANDAQAVQGRGNAAWSRQRDIAGPSSSATGFDYAVAQGYSDSPTIVPVRYQFPQNAGGIDGPYPIWPNASPSPNSYSPTRLSPGMSSNGGTGLPGQPSNTNLTPQPAGTYPGQQFDRSFSAPGGYPTMPETVSSNSGTGLPAAMTPGLQQPPFNGPIDGMGGYGEQLPFDATFAAAGQGIAIADGRRIIRIPIRLGPHEQIDIKNEDIILNEGDIVFIESRDAEVFFTGGLLGGGQYTLPRDYDLDILQAISLAGSRLNSNGAMRAIGGVSALNSDVTVSPSAVVVLRKLPEGGEIPIKINLYDARSDLAERIFIQPGDYIYLQYTPLEAFAAFIDRHLIEGALFGLIAQQASFNRNGN